MKVIPKYIDIIVDGDPKSVASKDYVAAKTKQLQEYGYSSVTEGEVALSLLRSLNGTATTVIDKLVQSDIKH